MRISRALRAIQSSLTPAKPSWTHTLHLPKSKFPPIPPRITPEAIHDVTTSLYSWQRTNHAETEENPRFVLNDGPPYANGDLHLGHAINKILKDFILRFQIASGRKVEYVPGWDCHGLPIELKALQQLPKGQHGKILESRTVRKLARSLATETVERQKGEFLSWGVIGDWENAYRTMDATYVARELEIFKDLAAKKLITYELMPVYYSPSSGTVLAESELEYDANHTSTCAFVRYPLTDATPFEQFRKDGVDPDRLGALIWTTTPWTLPGNRLIAVGSNIIYCVVSIKSCQCVVAESRLEFVRQHLPNEEIRLIKGGIPGSSFAQKTRYVGPGDLGLRLLVDAKFVTDSAGTGLVHVAPGHGFDDFLLGKKHDIEAASLVDEQARFIDDHFGLSTLETRLRGESIWAGGNEKVLQSLQSLEGSSPNMERILFATHKLEHKYPIDWRTKEPVVILPKQQWFIRISQLKDSAVKALDDVKFVPQSGKNRLQAFVEGRDHWCISRQRAWGVPIPVLYHRRKGTLDPWVPMITPEDIGQVIEKINSYPSDDWFGDSSTVLLEGSKWLPRHADPKMEYRKSGDTMDVWFDSGTAWSMLSSDKSHLADVYLEGSDQHRGWFQSSLLTRIASTGEPVAPFKTLITHGFALDGEGKKMSKSLGNVISPKQLLLGQYAPESPAKKGTAKKPQKKQAINSLIQHPVKAKTEALGPDLLRYWIASIDYTKDVSVSQESLETTARGLKKLRITFKWLLGVLKNYSPPEWYPKSPTNRTMDEITLENLKSFTEKANWSFEQHDFAAVTRLLREYITDLSSGYFEHAKDRLYTGTQAERESARFVLHHIHRNLLRILAPITPFMVREVGLVELSNDKPFLMEVLAPGKQNVGAFYPDALNDGEGDRCEYLNRFLGSAKQAINTLQEIARNEFKMKSGLDCDVAFYVGEPLHLTRKDDGQNFDQYGVSLFDEEAEMWRQWKDQREQNPGTRPNSYWKRHGTIRGQTEIIQELFGKGMEETLAAALVVSNVKILDQMPPVREVSKAKLLPENKDAETGVLIAIDKAQGAEAEQREMHTLTGGVLLSLRKTPDMHCVPLYIQITTPPKGDKCGRCWRYQQVNERDLCIRCEGEVGLMEADMTNTKN